jgi:hypothetical protein
VIVPTSTMTSVKLQNGILRCRYRFNEPTTEQNQRSSALIIYLYARIKPIKFPQLHYCLLPTDRPTLHC